MKTLYLDCFSGASGDMLTGALIDAGADFAALRTCLESLGVDGFEVRADRTVKHGIRATQFRVIVKEDHDHPHRHLADVLAIIDGASLPDAVRAGSAAVFRRIAEVEAAIHNTSVDEIHFHEVGAVDSIVDIVGAHAARHLLGIEQTFASALALGHGTIKCAHGVLPVPAPATAALLEGVPCYAGEVAAELTTPTGAALVSQWAAGYGPMTEMRIASIGYGAGQRDLPGRPNVLRAIVGEADSVLAGTETICVVEANVDDMPAELLAPLMADFLTRGAKDAFVTPILGKKGRPGHLITVLCGEAGLADVTRCFFLGSSTFGVRIRSERRICLEREWKKAKTPWGEVRVKIAHFEDQVCRTAPEFEDCRALAERARVPVLSVYQQALAAAVKGELEDV